MSDPIGSALSAFGSSKLNQEFYNKRANKNLNYLGKQFQGDNADYNNALDAFKGANAATSADYARLRPQTEADYNTLLDKQNSYDPMADYERLRGGNLGALKDWSGIIGDMGSRGDKLALAAMGMAGRPDSSYGTILRADRVSRNLAPVLGNIMSSLGNDTNTIGNQRTSNLSNSMGIINARNQTPMLGYGLQMDPANALMAIRSGQLGQLGQTGDIAKNNTAGWTLEPDMISRVGTSMNNFNDSMWQNIGNVASLYSDYMSGGTKGADIKTGNASNPGGGYGQNGGFVGGGGGGGGGGYVPASTGNMANYNTYPAMVNTPYQQPQYNPWNTSSLYGGAPVDSGGMFSNYSM